MDTSVKQKIEEFEKKRVSLLDEMEGLDEAMLEARPINGKCLILEIIEYLKFN